MAITMYSASAPVFTRQLKGLLGWLDKAQAHAEMSTTKPLLICF